MKAFAELLDRLSYTAGRNAKLTLMADYFRAAPDPDRGYALESYHSHALGVRPARALDR